jgi:hypothetical protein
VHGSRTVDAQDDFELASVEQRDRFVRRNRAVRCDGETEPSAWISVRRLHHNAHGRKVCKRLSAVQVNDDLLRFKTFIEALD